MNATFLNPAEQIKALGLEENLDLSGLIAREKSFEYVHFGELNLPIGLVFDFINASPGLCPPRSGHIGNWEQIILGRSGAIDFNKSICVGGHGYPLIHCFTQTEAEFEGKRHGDWVYLPGSIMEKGRREILPLYTWDGSAFSKRSGEVPLFCPFVQTEVSGQRIPLIELHWTRIKSFARFHFELEAGVVIKNATQVKEMLSVLLEEAAKRENVKRAFQDLFSHSVSKDGKSTRSELRTEEKAYWLDDCFYPSRDLLIEAALLPFLAVTEPRDFFSKMGSYPEKIPIISNLLMTILSASFLTHYSPSIREDKKLQEPFNLHFHWGARECGPVSPTKGVSHGNYKTGCRKVSSKNSRS